MDELKPCPFCGGKAHVVDGIDYWILCEDCHCRTGFFDRAEDAAEAWNRRAE